MNLKYIREEHEMTQRAVAQILGVARSAYAAWEEKISIIPLKRLIDFCNYFDVSLDYALGLTRISTYPNMRKDFDFELYRKRIKRIRKENDYTQDKIAKLLNTDNGVISRYESGKTTILTSFLVEYAKIFCVSTDYLIGRIDEKIKVKELILD